MVRLRSGVRLRVSIAHVGEMRLVRRATHLGGIGHLSLLVGVRVMMPKNGDRDREGPLREVRRRRRGEAAPSWCAWRYRLTTGLGVVERPSPMTGGSMGPLKRLEGGLDLLLRWTDLRAVIGSRS